MQGNRAGQGFDAIFVLNLIIAWLPLVVNYIDLTAEFDKIPRSLLSHENWFKILIDLFDRFLQLLYPSTTATIAWSDAVVTVGLPDFVWYFGYVMKVDTTEITFQRMLVSSFAIRWGIFSDQTGALGCHRGDLVNKLYRGFSMPIS